MPNTFAFLCLILALVAFIILAFAAAVSAGHLWVIAAIGLALFAAAHLPI